MNVAEIALRAKEDIDAVYAVGKAQGGDTTAAKTEFATEIYKGATAIDVSNNSDLSHSDLIIVINAIETKEIEMIPSRTIDTSSFWDSVYLEMNDLSQSPYTVTNAYVEKDDYNDFDVIKGTAIGKNGKNYDFAINAYNSYKYDFNIYNLMSAEEIPYFKTINIKDVWFEDGGFYYQLYEFVIAEHPKGEVSTLTLGAANIAKLTEEEKAIATDKGWNVV